MVDNVEHVGRIQIDANLGTINESKDKPTQQRHPIGPVSDTIPITSMEDDMEVGSDTHHCISEGGGMPEITIESIVANSLKGRRKDEGEKEKEDFFFLFWGGEI